MPFTTVSQGLTLSIPTSGTRNWAANTLTNTWTKISAHDHSGSGNGTPLSASGLAANSVTSPKLAKNIALAVASTLTPSGTTQTIDFDLGNNQELNLGSATGDVTVTLSNPQAGATYRIWITQGATARSIVWPAAVKWPQSQAAILSTTNGAVDLVELYYTGSVYRAIWELDFS